MRVSNHNGRVDKAARHNDRNFDVTRSDHISADKSKSNIYWTYDGDLSVSFKEKELQFYKEHFGVYLDKKNAHYKEIKCKSDMRTMEYYHASKATRPEDKILQIGDMKEHATPEQLWECALAYQKEFDEKYGDKIKILDMALHVDEATPHVHLRRVWIGHDEDGQECVGQTKVLNELGVLPPDASKPNSRYNNPKMTFTYEDNAMFREIVRERGFEIEEPNHTRRKSLSIAAYKTKKLEEEKQELEEEIEQIRETKAQLEEEMEEQKSAVVGLKKEVAQIGNTFEDLLLDPVFNGEYEREVKEAKKKSEEERTRVLIGITMKKALVNITHFVAQKIPESHIARKNARLRKRLRAAETVIKEHHLSKEYKEEKEKSIIL